MIDVLLKKFCRWNRYRAWSDGSIWLSLDRFERFWPDVGLTLHVYLTYASFDRAWEEAVHCTQRADTDALVRWNVAFREEHDFEIPDYEAIIPDNVHGPW